MPLFSVMPDHFSGNRKAISIKDKDLIKEYESYAERAANLCVFTWKLSRHLWKPSQHALPERPSGLLFPQKETQAEQLQKKADKLLKRQRQAAAAMAGEVRKKGVS